MTDVLDVEVLSDETTFTPDLSALPTTEPSGWCNDALTLPLPQPELDRLHDQCPAVFLPMTWPDPGRKGATYTTPGRRCSCVCHTRPVL